MQKRLRLLLVMTLTVAHGTVDKMYRLTVAPRVLPKSRAPLQTAEGGYVGAIEA